jgi:hypothetical protein
MRAVALLIVSISMLIAVSARAQLVDGSFDLGVWRGSPASTDGGFTACDMEALFGRRDSPVALTIGLDRLRGWSVTLRSDEFMMHSGGQIRAGLAFDEEPPVDVTGDVISPSSVSFRFPTTTLLDRHQQARKLVLVLSDAALPFALSQFAEATQALRACVAANVTSSSEQAATAPLALPVSAAADLKPSQAAPADARLLSRIVTPLMVGFVGSVLLVLLFGAVLFQIIRARAQSRYFRLWTAEYRASVTPVLAMGLLDQRAAA